MAKEDTKAMQEAKAILERVKHDVPSSLSTVLDWPIKKDLEMAVTSSDPDGNPWYGTVNFVADNPSEQFVEK